jgi:aromatase
MAAQTESEIVINAPLGLVWDMTNDVESWPALYTEYAKVEILERDGDTIRFRLHTHPDNTGTVWSWVSERTPDPQARTVRARRIETGPFLEKMDMFWDYTQTPEGVRMRCAQEIELRPNVGIDDAGAIAFLNHQTRTEMAHIKEVIEATWAAAQATR